MAANTAWQRTQELEHESAALRAAAALVGPALEAGRLRADRLNTAPGAEAGAGIAPRPLVRTSARSTQRTSRERRDMSCY